MTTVLAIDQGTTSTKGFLLSDSGILRPLGGIIHRQILPKPGHVEHDAGELLHAIETLIDRALEDGPIAAMALANQGETVVAWDLVTGEPLYNAIVWQDQRTQSLIDGFGAAQRDLITARSGLPCDAYFSAAKLGWLLREIPAVAHAARQNRLGLGTSDAFFLHRLTGIYATDVTTGSRTSLMNLTTCQWDPDLCALFGVPIDLLPEIRPTQSDFGTVNRHGKAIPIVASLVDQQAALFGHGCRNKGDAKITFGTGSFALAITGTTPPASAGLVPTVAWQRRNEAPLYAIDAGDYTAAAAVDWCLSIGLGQSLADFDFADGTPTIQRGMAFVPALAGLAAPYWRRDVRAAFVGMTQATTAEDMRKAVLEGIALRGADLIDMVCGAGQGAVSVDGGLSRNAYFIQFLSNVLNRPLRLRGTADLTGLGAAQLGMDWLGHRTPEPLDMAPRVIMPDSFANGLSGARAYFRAAVDAQTAIASHRLHHAESE